MPPQCGHFNTAFLSQREVSGHSLGEDVKWTIDVDVTWVDSIPPDSGSVSAAEGSFN